MSPMAVITGDIVRSSALDQPALEAVFAALSSTATEIGRWQGTPVPFSRFRGDGWQLAMQPAHVLRALIALRAAVRAQGKALDTRAAVGIGPGRLGATGLADAEGPAFTASGRALDEMKRPARLAAPEAPLPLRTALPLTDQIIRGWTAKQAEIVAGLIAPDAPSQADLARSFGVRRQLVQKQADAAGLHALLAACTTLESSESTTD